MSDIPRYKPVSNDRLGIADDADGKLCEYRDYEKLKSTVQSFAANVLRLGNEVRDLSISNAVLRDDNDKLKAELRKRALESLSDIGQMGEQSAEIANLKAEVERLRASSFVTAVPVEQYERVVKAGDAVALDYAERIEIEAGETAKTLMKTLPVLRDWRAAKEGKPSV